MVVTLTFLWSWSGRGLGSWKTWSQWCLMAFLAPQILCLNLVSHLWSSAHYYPPHQSLFVVKCQIRSHRSIFFYVQFRLLFGILELLLKGLSLCVSFSRCTDGVCVSTTRLAWTVRDAKTFTKTPPGGQQEQEILTCAEVLCLPCITAPHHMPTAPWAAALCWISDCITHSVLVLNSVTLHPH